MIVQKTLNGSGEYNILILSGVHGNETHAVAATYQLYEDLEKNLSKEFGKVTFVFNVNEYGLISDTRDNLYETETSKNCNRLFPNRYKTSEQIKKYIEELNELRPYDLVLDVHNSSCCISCVLVDYDENTNRLLGLLHDSPLVPLVRNTQIGTIKKFFNEDNNVYAYTVELGEMGVRGDYIHSAILLKQFIEQIISNFNNVKIEINLTQDYVVKTLCTRTNNGIIRYEKENPCTYYQKGEPICTVKNMETSEVEYIEAPFDGILYDIDDNIYSYSGKEFGMFGKKIEV